MGTSLQSLDCKECWNDQYLHHRNHYVEDFTDSQHIPPLHESRLTLEETIQRQSTIIRTPSMTPNNSGPTIIEQEIFHDAVDTIQPRNLLEDLDTNISTPTTDSSVSDEVLPIIPEDRNIEEPVNLKNKYFGDVGTVSSKEFQL
jgi:hypothetical protein